MDQFKEGTVFELSENSNQDYIVLKKIELNEEIYLIISPVMGDVNNLKMNASKLMILKVDEVTNDVHFVKDEDKISKVIDRLFE